MPGGVPFSAERRPGACGVGNWWFEKQRCESYEHRTKRAGILMASYNARYLHGRVTDLRGAHDRANQTGSLLSGEARRGTGDMRLKQTGAGGIACEAMSMQRITVVTSSVMEGLKESQHDILAGSVMISGPTESVRPC